MVKFTLRIGQVQIQLSLLVVNFNSYKEIGIIGSTSLNNKYSVMIKDNKVYNSESSLSDVSGEYMRVYRSADNAYIRILKTCTAYVLYTDYTPKAGNILQLAANSLYQWNANYTGIGVVIVL